MRKEWKSVKMGEVVELKQGLCFNKKSKHLISKTGIPVLTINDLKNNTVSQYTDENLTPSRYISKPTDIIYSRTGQVGLVFTNKYGVIHNNCFRIIPNNDVYPMFIYWYLKQKALIKHANNIAGGSAQPDLGHAAFKSIPFTYPIIDVQKKVVNVLSSYDTLIDNNTSRIQILEEMAQRIYKEWFVDFKYPGHENDELVDSELGMIPEGWEVKKLKQIINLARRNINPSSNPDEKFYHFSIPAFDKRYMPMVEIGKTILSNKYQITGDCILFSKLNPRIKRIWLPFIEKNLRSIASTEFLMIEPKPGMTLNYLYQALSCDSFYRKVLGMSIGTSTSHQRIKPNDFIEMNVLIPKSNLIDNFEEISHSIINEIHILREKSNNLRQTRDLLLPKLISGKVDVSDLDIDTSILND